MAYDNTNSGALFLNDRKETEKHPDFRGTINVDGTEYWVSGWTKDIQNGPKRGESMISLALTPKQASGGSPSRGGQSGTARMPGRAGSVPASPSNQDDEFDDDIPF